jgi:hypothetical protein
VADPEEIKRKLRELKKRISDTQESIERVRETIAPGAKSKARKNVSPKKKDS